MDLTEVCREGGHAHIQKIRLKAEEKWQYFISIQKEMLLNKTEGAPEQAIVLSKCSL